MSDLNKNCSDEALHNKTDVLLPYYVVEFINRGRKPNIKKVDIVVSSWLSIHDKTKKVITKFPNAPYDSLGLYLKYQLDAPSSWLTYQVRIRGKAGTLEEAEKKVNFLNEVESTLTLSSDENFSEAEKNVTDLLKENLLFKKANQFKRKIVEDINKEEEHQKDNDFHEYMDTENKSEYYESDYDECDADVINTELNKEIDQSTMKIQQIYNDISSVGKENMQLLIEDSEIPIQTLTNDQVILKNKTQINSKTVSSCSADAMYKNKGLSEVALQKNERKRKYKNSSTNINKKNEISDNQLAGKKVKCTCQDSIKDSLASILYVIKDLKSEIKANSAEINSLKAMLLQTSKLNYTEFISNTKELSSKYRCNIPLESLREFKIFDDKLKDDKSDLRRDIRPIIRPGLDGSLIISKSIVNIFKMFLTKNVALHFTASKKVPNKEVMKETNFYIIIESLIKEERVRMNVSNNDKDFSGALSNVLTNVAGWKDIRSVNPSINLRSIPNNIQRIKIKNFLNDEEKNEEVRELVQQQESDDNIIGTYNLLPINGEDDFELLKIQKL